MSNPLSDFYRRAQEDAAKFGSDYFPPWVGGAPQRAHRITRPTPSDRKEIEREQQKREREDRAKMSEYASKITKARKRLEARLTGKPTAADVDPPPELSPVERLERRMSDQERAQERRELTDKAFRGDANAIARLRAHEPEPFDAIAAGEIRRDREQRETDERQGREQREGTAARREAYNRERERIAAAFDAREDRVKAKCAEQLNTLTAERERALAELGEQP